MWFWFALLRVRNRGRNLIQGRPSSRSFRIDCCMRLLHPQFVWQSLTGFIVWCLSASLHNEAARITRSSPGRRKSHLFFLPERTPQSGRPLGGARKIQYKTSVVRKVVLLVGKTFILN